MTKDQLRMWVAIIVLAMWLIAVFFHATYGRALAAAVGIILTWLFLRKNGNGHAA